MVAPRTVPNVCGGPAVRVARAAVPQSQGPGCPQGLAFTCPTWGLRCTEGRYQSKLVAGIGRDTRIST